MSNYTLSREDFTAEAAEQIHNIWVRLKMLVSKHTLWDNMWKHSNKLENVKSKLLDEIIIQ